MSLRDDPSGNHATREPSPSGLGPTGECQAYWSQAEAIELCRQIEEVCPPFGCHVALTGGTLYRVGSRKDVDILFYRIRQVDQIDEEGLFGALAKIGVSRLRGFGWCVKAEYHGKQIDCFFPEEEGEYPTVDDPGEPEFVPFPEVTF